MIGRAYTMTWEGLNRKLSWLVLSTVGMKNSALLGSLYVSDGVGVNASEIHSLNLDAVCLDCWHLTHRLPRGQGTQVQSPLVLQVSRLESVNYFPSLKIANAKVGSPRCQPVTMETRVRFWASLYGYCGGQSGTGRGVSSSTAYFIFVSLNHCSVLLFQWSASDAVLVWS
jgi:hypothetical protein